MTMAYGSNPWLANPLTQAEGSIETLNRMSRLAVLGVRSG